MITHKVLFIITLDNWRVCSTPHKPAASTEMN
jgi:hypothetical protein